MLVLWFDITQRHIEHSGANRMVSPYKYILTTAVMYSQQLCVLHWIGNSLVSNNYFPQYICFLKITHLYKSCICWLDSMRVSYSRETQATLMEMVEIKKTHTHTHTKHWES